MEVDRFVQGVDVNGGNGSTIILGYRDGVEPEILLEALGTAYGFIESARIDIPAINFEAGVHVLAKQYRKNNIGNYECLTCGLRDIDETVPRRLQ